MSNMHHLFHSQYFGDLEFGRQQYDRHNQVLVGQGIPIDALTPQNIPMVDTFNLRVRYPGLLIGLGYPHEVSKDMAGVAADGAVKIGFSFDYVTGLPYLPGSSIKGTLRSAFRGEKAEYVAELLKNKDVMGETEKIIGATARHVQKIEKAIFGEWTNEPQTPRSQHQDVFFDAFPVPKDGTKKLLNLDSITPHPNQLKDPKPLKMLRVRPGVVFCFRFRLGESRIAVDGVEYVITPLQKKALFKRILLDLGIGAKTNVGYGVLEEVENQNTAEEDHAVLPEVFSEDDAAARLSVLGTVRRRR